MLGTLYGIKGGYGQRDTREHVADFWSGRQKDVAGLAKIKLFNYRKMASKKGQDGNGTIQDESTNCMHFSQEKYSNQKLDQA